MDEKSSLNILYKGELIMRKTIISIFAIILIGSLITSCSQSSSEGGENSEDSNEKVTLSFWRAGTDTLENEYWKRVIKDYEEENPNIKIELTELPWGTEIDTKLNTAFVGNTAPDVIS